MRGGQRQDHVLAVARDDDERPGATRSSMWLGSIAPMATPSITRSRSGPGWITRPPTPWSTMPSVGLDRIGQYGQHAEERDAVQREAALERPLDPGLVVHADLVDEGAGDRHAVRGEVGRIEHDLVDRPPYAALGHDHRRRPQLETPRWRWTGRSPRRRRRDRCPRRAARRGRRTPRARHRSVRRGPPPPRRAMYDLVKPRGMWTGLITPYGSGRPKTVPHQDGVLVGRDPVLDDRPLADRLHEPGAQAAPPEAVEQPERGGGLAAVLAGGGEVQVAHPDGGSRARSGWRVSPAGRSCARSAPRPRAAA